MTAFSVPENLAFDNYSDLTAAIAEWMDRSDLTGSVQTMIALAESRMRRKLEPVFGEATATVSTTDGTGAQPTGCAVINRIVYDNRTLPHYSSFSAGDLSDPSIYPEPIAYTVEADMIRLWPPVDGTLTVFYRQTLPQLSESSPTNTMLSSHPDLYFFGAMMFAEGYVANDNRAAMFKALFDEGLDEAALYFDRQRYSGPLAPRIAR